MDQRLSEEDARIWGAFGTLDVPSLLQLSSLLVEVCCRQDYGGKVKLESRGHRGVELSGCSQM